MTEKEQEIYWAERAKLDKSNGKGNGNGIAIPKEALQVRAVNALANSTGFWNFNIGHVFVLLAMLGGFAAWWPSYGNLPKAIETLQAQVNATNISGTVGSQLRDENEVGRLSALEARVTVMENQYQKLLQMDTEIEAKLDVFRQLLEGKKPQPHTQ